MALKQKMQFVRLVVIGDAAKLFLSKVAETCGTTKGKPKGKY